MMTSLVSIAGYMGFRFALGLAFAGAVGMIRARRKV